MRQQNLKSAKNARCAETRHFTGKDRACRRHNIEMIGLVGHTFLLYSCANRFAAFHGFFDRSDHIECIFRKIVVFTADDSLETLDGVFQLHVLTGRAGELLGNEEWL